MTNNLPVMVYFIYNGQSDILNHLETESLFDLDQMMTNTLQQHFTISGVWEMNNALH